MPSEHGQIRKRRYTHTNLCFGCVRVKICNYEVYANGDWRPLCSPNCEGLKKYLQKIKS